MGEGKKGEEGGRETEREGERDGKGEWREAGARRRSRVPVKKNQGIWRL